MVNDAEPFEQTLTEGAMWNLVKTGLAVSEKKTNLKIMQLYTGI